MDYPDPLSDEYILLLEELQKQKKELTDSIRYASYIQQAMLPPLDLFMRLLPESVVFFKPRELVSGDFYWIGKYRKKIIVAAVDCTGHGVPGGLMSVMGISFLNEIVGRGEVTSAASLLNQLRERVMKALHQTGRWDEQKDGMDIALCIIDADHHIMHFAGANNPAYVIRDQELIEIPGDKMPIGVHMVTERSFTNHTLDILENDKVYIFTDGFIDQFGGEKGKKFKNTRFRELMSNVAEIPFAEQYQVLDCKLAEWKRDLPQIDDILIVGFSPYVACQSKLLKVI
ncbi:MAG: SpoIIE family protein phosphatase [Bacteroidales bacterium]|nr:SpoIIE family protein phosphatase [Bacteroidales bacterium]